MVEKLLCGRGGYNNCGKEISSPSPSQRSLVELHNSGNSTESPSSGVDLQLEKTTPRGMAQSVSRRGGGRTRSGGGVGMCYGPRFEGEGGKARRMRWWWHDHQRQHQGHAPEWLKGWRGLAVALALAKPSALHFLEVVQERGDGRGWMLISPVPGGISILVIYV